MDGGLRYNAVGVGTAPGRSDLAEHQRIVAWLNVGSGALNLVFGLAVLGVLGYAKYLLRVTSDAPTSSVEAAGWLTVLVVLLATFFIVTSVPEVVGGLGLVRRRRGP